MHQRIRASLKRNIPIACAAYIASDVITKVRFALGFVGTRSGAVHLDMPVDASIAYIERVFASYKSWAGVDRFSGRVAEVGPGDSCGIGLLFRHDGCEHVDLLDRFSSMRNPAQQAAIYRELYRRYPALAAATGTPRAFAKEEFAGVRRHTGPAAAAERFFRSNTGYDYVVSCAVLEHLYDPLRALRDMSAALKRGGAMIHAVDLRDHGMFSEQHDDTTFLEIPAPIYRLMTQSSGRPNRVPFSLYRTALSHLPLEAETLVGSLFGETGTTTYVPFDDLESSRKQAALELIEGRRHRFAAPLRELPTADLIVSGFCIVARRR